MLVDEKLSYFLTRNKPLYFTLTRELHFRRCPEKTLCTVCGNHYEREKS
jgi:hypothetical protein